MHEITNRTWFFRFFLSQRVPALHCSLVSLKSSSSESPYTQQHRVPRHVNRLACQNKVTDFSSKQRNIFHTEHKWSWWEISLHWQSWSEANMTTEVSVWQSRQLLNFPLSAVKEEQQELCTENTRHAETMIRAAYTQSPAGTFVSWLTLEKCEHHAECMFMFHSN